MQIGPGVFLLQVRHANGQLDEAQATTEELESALAGPAAPGGLVDPTDLFLWVEAQRIRLSFAHDPLFAVSLSGVRGLRHQIEAVYRHMLPQPRLRFVLADDPGAGKTIMAGLLLKELKLRGVVERCLVLRAGQTVGKLRGDTQLRGWPVCGVGESGVPAAEVGGEIVVEHSGADL